jgi:general secretion pathway protein C
VVDDGPSLQPRGGPTTSLPAGAVTALGNNRFRIVGGWRRVMGEASQFALQARVVPAFENGQPAGFKLFSIRPGSTVSQLGFLNGDIINAIQGRPLTGPESVMEAYTNNLHENVVAVTLKRSGSPLTLTYEGVEDGDAGVQPVP